MIVPSSGKEGKSPAPIPSCLVNKIYQTCSSAERISERRLASRIQKGGEVTRQRSSQLPYLYQRVLFFYSHPAPRCALELGPPHAIVIPWSEQFADNVNSHPSSSWLATSAVLMQRGRGENIADKESCRSRCW